MKIDILSGGNKEKNISTNLIEALKYAKQIGAKILGIVGEMKDVQLDFHREIHRYKDDVRNK